MGVGSDVSSRGRGVVIVGAGVLLLSFDSLLVRLMTIPTASIIFWRGLFTAIGFSVLAWIFARPRNLGSELGIAGLSVGLLSATSSGLFVVSLSKTSVAQTLTILAAAPAITAVIARVAIHEELALRTWVAVAVVTVGIAAVFASSWGGPQVEGDLSALIASTSLSGSLVILRSHQTVNRLAALSWGGVVLALAGCAAAVVTRPLGGVISLNPHDALVSIVDALVIIPVSVGLISYGPRYLRAAEVSLLLLLETVFGPIYVWLVLGERPAAAVVGSAILVIGTLATHTVLEARAERRAGLNTQAVPDTPRYTEPRVGRGVAPNHRRRSRI